MSTPALDTAPTVTGFVPVTIPLGNNDPHLAECWVTVPGEPTATAGLVITPAMRLDWHTDRPAYSGGYGLTHAESGRALQLYRHDPDQLHRIAARLGQGVDWTRPAAQLETDQHALELVLDERGTDWF